MAGPKRRAQRLEGADPWIAGNGPFPTTYTPMETPTSRILPRGTHVLADSPENAAHALLVRQQPASDPIAGLRTPSYSGHLADLRQVSYYRTRDGVPRKGTVIVAPGPILLEAGGSLVEGLGLYAKITMGTERGAMAQWVGTPCIFPVEGAYVKVETTVSKVPFRVIRGGLPPVAPETGPWLCQSQTFVVDGWTDEGRSISLAQDVQCGVISAGVPQVPLAGTGGLPAIVDLITFANTNAADVLMAICDSDGLFDSVNQLLCVYVPAGSSVSVGRDLLGPFFTGITLVGIVPPPGLGTVEDPNGQDVYASVTGRVLQVGSG